MKLPGPALPQCHLQPGELVITPEPQWVITLLGSCVAVTMFNPRFHLAAICHAMLPHPHARNRTSIAPAERFRYLSHAVPAMLEKFLLLGLAPDELEVKIFGGGNVMHLDPAPPKAHWIGSINVAMAHRLLHAARLRIKAEQVGGSRGCKIAFNTRNGEVLHKFLSKKRPLS